MARYNWSRLNTLQVGAYAEYFVKMEFAMYGFEVYTSEVDDRGIDFVARYGGAGAAGGAGFVEVQVKSTRAYNYVFVHKSKFRLDQGRYLALVLLFDGEPPRLYLIPSTVWLAPNGVFVDNDYGFEGAKSKPEYGINLSQKNMPALEPFLFDPLIERLIATSSR